MTSADGPLRLACAGWVDADSGSISAANHRLLRAVVEDGHLVDFYANEGFLNDPGLAQYGRFRFVPIPVAESSVLKALDRLAGGRLARLHGWVLVRRFGRRMRRHVATAHEDDPYDALLFLGVEPLAEIADVPTFVWPQGLPGGELGFLRRRRRLVSRTSGLVGYWCVRGAYELRDACGWRWLDRAHVIVASHSSSARLRERGVPATRIIVLPYPIDLERFAPGDRADDGRDTVRVVCLGRLDPRKRIDLLRGAAEVLAARGRPVEIEVIGRSGYLRGWEERVTGPEALQLGLRYQAHVDSPEVPRILRAADLVVQPSEDEEFGHAIAEALACGKRVVVGSSNATREYVPKAAGVVFDRYEPADVANALEQALLLDSASAADAARSSAEATFASRDVAASLMRAIRGVVR